MIFLIPTDTCYGLAGDLTSEDYREIYRLKGRSFDKRLAVLVRDFDMLREYGEITRAQMDFLEKYPYPWSVILPRRNMEKFPLPLRDAAYEHISFRVASECIPEFAISHIKKFPIFLTSANPSWGDEATNFSLAKKYFPQLDGVDGGACDAPPSDIFSFDADGNVVYVRKNY